MKSLILAVVGLGLLAGAALYLTRPQPPRSSLPEPATEPVAVQAPEAPPPAEPAPTGSEPVKSSPAPRAHSDQRAAPAAAPNKAAALEAGMFKQAVDALISPHVTYGQKQATWKQLSDAGKLDQVISDLGERMAADPRSPELPATLGQACLKKCAVIQDVREQGILAMQADKLFDTALNLDPANWEARFTKAVALSYWPAVMNKGEEVIQHFQTLIQQQEGQAPQPQFAEPYVWLGDQYQKAGRAEDARGAWERGANLFPNHQVLRTKLAALTVPQSATPAPSQ